MRLAALFFEFAFFLFSQLERRTVVDRRVTARHLPLAASLQFFRCLVASIKPARLLQLFGRLLIESEA